MDKNIKLIRKIIQARHGGLEDAPDGQILTIWNALAPDDQKRYLAEQEPERTANAPVD